MLDQLLHVLTMGRRVILCVVEVAQPRALPGFDGPWMEKVSRAYRHPGESLRRPTTETSLIASQVRNLTLSAGRLKILLPALYHQV